MALSVQQQPGGPDWPLGVITVATIGTKVCLMVNVDPNNNNSPNTPTAQGLNVTSSGFTVKARGIVLQGFHVGANNNGLVANTGNVYLLHAPAGGNGNRSDSGSIVAVITPSNNFFYAPDGKGFDYFCPYFYYLDADNNNDGALAVLFSPQGG